MPHVWALEAEESAKALELLDKALAIIRNTRSPCRSPVGAMHRLRLYLGGRISKRASRLALALAEHGAQLSGDESADPHRAGGGTYFTSQSRTARVLSNGRSSSIQTRPGPGAGLGWVDVYSDQSKQAIDKFERALRFEPARSDELNNYVGIGSAHVVDQTTTRPSRSFGGRWRSGRTQMALPPSGGGCRRRAHGGSQAGLRADVAHLSRPDGLEVSQAMVFSPAVLDRMVDNLKKLGLPVDGTPYRRDTGARRGYW